MDKPWKDQKDDDAVDALRYSFLHEIDKIKFICGWDLAKCDDLGERCDDPVTTLEGDFEPV